MRVGPQLATMCSIDVSTWSDTSLVTSMVNDQLFRDSRMSGMTVVIRTEQLDDIDMLLRFVGDKDVDVDVHEEEALTTITLQKSDQRYVAGTR